jgi:ABC-2 type transport system ATP-binding protein
VERGRRTSGRSARDWGAKGRKRATLAGVPAIEVVALHKTYRGLFGRGGQPALRGVDLEVPAGTAFGLIGLNGAGKTTFIKAILGIIRPTSGKVRILDGGPDDPRIRARIGYLPERLHLPNAFTPVAFLASVGRLKRLARAREAIERQLGRVGLSGDAERKIGGFSKGMRQRLGLAAALLGNPDLLVLDEPTDGVDPLGRAEIRLILAEERSRGATLFLNSHLLSETERICDRIGILDGGRLVRQGALDALSGSPTRFRVRFAQGCDAAALRAIGFEPIADATDMVGRPADQAADAFRCNAADPVALNELLDRARSAGALLIGLSRDMRDLEEILAEALGGAAADPSAMPGEAVDAHRGTGAAA